MFFISECCDWFDLTVSRHVLRASLVYHSLRTAITCGDGSGTEFVVSSPKTANQNYFLKENSWRYPRGPGQSSRLYRTRVETPPIINLRVKKPVSEIFIGPSNLQKQYRLIEMFQ